MRIPFLRKKESAIVTPGASVYFPFPVGVEFDSKKVARESYAMNVRAHAAIRMRATACAGIPWLLFSGDNEIITHPLLTLLEKPNRYQARSSWIAEMVSNLDIHGNNFIEGVSADRPGAPPSELYNHSSQYIRVVPGTDTKVAYYQYDRSGKTIKWTPEQMLHQKTYDPTNDFMGMPPLSPAAISIDQNNQAKIWNLNLLKNGARVGGILSSKNIMADKSVQNLKKQFAEEHQGAVAAGTPIVLQGDFQWQPMTMNANDIDWAEGQKVSGREIALSFLMPPEMLGDSENKTYSNYMEARKAFYIESVLPTMDMIQDDFNWWLVPKYGKNLRLEYNRDAIEALSENRGEVWASAIEAVKAGVLTPNEAREIMQYDDIEGGDELRPQPTGQFNLVDGRGNPKDNQNDQQNEEEEIPPEEAKAFRIKKNNRREPGKR